MLDVDAHRASRDAAATCDATKIVAMGAVSSTCQMNHHIAFIAPHTPNQTPPPPQSSPSPHHRTQPALPVSFTSLVSSSSNALGGTGADRSTTAPK